MREIKVKDIALTVENMLIDACQNIPENVLCALRNAKENALRAVDELEQQIRAKEQQYSDVKTQFDIYKAKMESLLISQSELIREMNQE